MPSSVAFQKTHDFGNPHCYIIKQLISSAQIVLLITRTDTITRLKLSEQGANILLVILFTTISAIRALLQVLPLDTTSTAATEWRAQGEIDVLLRIQTDDKAGDVHQLLANTANAKNIE
jgi:hypothetical protein